MLNSTLSVSADPRGATIGTATDDISLPLTPVAHQGHEDHDSSLFQLLACNGPRFTARPVAARARERYSHASPAPSTASTVHAHANAPPLLPLLSTPANRRQERPVNGLVLDAGSPSRLRSPLRQSVSYSDPPHTASRYCEDEWPLRSDTTSPTMPYNGESRPRGSPMSNFGSRIPTRVAHASPAGSDLLSEPLSDSTVVTLTKVPTSHSGSISPNPTSAPSAGASRFSIFTSSMSLLKGFKSPTAPSSPEDEKLLSLDIESALFPAGSPSDRDTFSPSAFKNLQMTASGLLHKFQSAYQYRTAELRVLQAEREAQSDEKEEAEIRMRHLKMQLEDMARKAAQQEAVMQALMEEIAREKKLRLEERSAAVANSAASEDLGAEEDLQRRKTWRESVGTAKSELSFETDEESMEGASVFSRSRSPTIATTLSEISPSPVETPVLQVKPVMLSLARPPARPSLPQMNAFQRLFKGSAADAGSRDDTHGPSSCRNCQGQEASVAWDTVNLLKEENKGLKDRVGELETAVDTALDAVLGIGL